MSDLFVPSLQYIEKFVSLKIKGIINTAIFINTGGTFICVFICLLSP
jgi:hypothetical protein